MVIVGSILLALGILLGIVGDVMFLTVAYRRSVWWFFGCLLIPVVWLFFFLLNENV